MATDYSEDETVLLSTPPPKRKRSALKGAATYKTIYNPEWAKNFPITVANNNKYALYCIPCKKNVLCGHMGIGDVKQHCRTAGHNKMVAAIKSSRSIQQFAPSSSSKKHLVSYMMENPFAFYHDGSSDASVKKMNPVCVSIFDVNSSKIIETKFYDMCATTGEECGKAETLFKAIDSNFTKDSISWTNAVAVGLDNTAVNMGCNNSIKV